MEVRFSPGNMGRLNKHEIENLLEEPIVSFITTLRPDGSPHTSPVWHKAVSGNLVVVSDTDSVKVRNIHNDQRVSLVVAANRSPQPWVQVNGLASITSPENINHTVSDLAYHYMGPKDAPGYVRDILGLIKFVLITIRPGKVIGFDGDD